MKPKLMRITTVPISLLVLLKEQLKYMANHFDVLAVSSGGEVLKKVNREALVPIEAIEMTRKISPFADLKALIKLVALMKREKPMIVHTHTPKAGLLGMIASKIAGVPIRLHTIAGLPILEKKGATKWILSQTEKITCACATVVYPNSKGIQEIMISNNYCKKEKLKIIAQGSTSGIDTNYFNPDFLEQTSLNYLRENLNISSSHFVYCFIGRIVKDKGIIELVTAFCNLYLNNTSIILLLVGPFEQDLDPLDEDMVNTIKNHPGIRWVDFVKDVRPYFAISNLFVFPSYREGFPNVVMQAGAMNIPCIVSDINGCNEIIINNENGLIVPVKNINILEETMDYFFQNPIQCNKMSLKSRALIQERFESTMVIEKLFDEYNYQLELVKS